MYTRRESLRAANASLQLAHSPSLGRSPVNPQKINTMAAPSSEQQQSLAAITKSVLSGDTLILRGPVVQANALPR